MRQAGRYMPEYRAVRAKLGFLELCKNSRSVPPRVMLTAVGRLGVDAAIIFSDLLLILEPMGLELEFTAGEGPALPQPDPRSAATSTACGSWRRRPLEFVLETVRQTRAGLPESAPPDRLCRRPVHAGRPTPSKGAPAATTASPRP